MTALAGIKRIAIEHAFRTRVRLCRLNGRSVANPHELFGGVSDRFWRWVVLRSSQHRYGLEGLVPGVPDDEMQQNWTGSTGESTLQGAFDFYRLVVDQTRAHGRPITRNTRVLDFGCGWGRIIRFFLRDVDHWHLHGCDCYPEALVQARRNSRWGHFVLIDPRPPAPLRDASFDVIYLYSVFSHFAEAIHLAGTFIGSFARAVSSSPRRGSGHSFSSARPCEPVRACLPLPREAQRRSATRRTPWRGTTPERSVIAPPVEAGSWPSPSTGKPASPEPTSNGSGESSSRYATFWTRIPAARRRWRWCRRGDRRSQMLPPVFRKQSGNSLENRSKVLQECVSATGCVEDAAVVLLEVLDQPDERVEVARALELRSAARLFLRRRDSPQPGKSTGEPCVGRSLIGRERRTRPRRAAVRGGRSRPPATSHSRPSRGPRSRGALRSWDLPAASRWRRPRPPDHPPREAR